MTSAKSTPITLHADQEHDTLRTVVILFLITFFFLSYLLVNTILQLDFWGSISDYAVSLSCVLGLVLALAVSAVVENLLKRVWHSGRSLTLTDNGIEIQEKKASVKTIKQSGNAAQLNWYFNLKGYRRGGREKRLSNQWLCLACQLQQGGTRLIAHAYMPPQKAKVWLENENQPEFHQIEPGSVYESSFSSRLGAPTRPQISNEILASGDGRYWLAERHRWDEGFELSPDDFATFMAYLARK
jgi:hypothetical protein